MKYLTLFMLAISLFNLGTSQTHTQTFEREGSTYQYEALNEVDKPLALLVLFNGGAGKAAKILPETHIPDSAVGYNYKVIGIDQSEFFLSETTYGRIKSIITHVMKKEGIKQNLFLGGFSLGGYTSLRFAEMAVERKDSTMIPQAVFAIDPPLDHMDFVKYCHRELDRKCPHEEAAKLGKAEAHWILNYYRQNFGSYPADSTAYMENSCFTATLANGGNGRFLKDIPIHMIHEIDPMWLIQERCRDVSDTNAVIGSKLVNFLHGLGNTAATITLTSNKGYRADGRRHPHSWSIAEPIPTLDWLSQYIHP